MNYEPPRDKAELKTFDIDEMIDGYREAQWDDPEPGHNRGRSYWYGWLIRMKAIFGDRPH